MTQDELTPELARQRLVALAGRTVSELKQGAKKRGGGEIRAHKGAVGQWVELAIGMTPNNRKGPDVGNLEIKTLPIRAGKVAESTYVTTLPHASPWPSWPQSEVARKLAHIAFVPVSAERNVAHDDQRIGAAIFMSLEGELYEQLQADWNLLAELAVVRGYDGLNARHGHWLHVRPKARDASSRALRANEDGVFESVQPRGFYLRPSFATEVIRRSLLR